MEVDAPVPCGRCGRSAEQSTGCTPSSRKMIGTPAVRPLSVRCSRGSHQRRGVVRVDAVQQEATARARELQRSWYGEPLGALFRRLIDDLGLNQARLAAVLGLSAPMLSQLMSGQRAKIGNPAVVQRVQALQDLAGQVADGSVSAGEATDRMDEIKKTQGVPSSATAARPPPAPAHPRSSGSSARSSRCCARSPRPATSSTRRTPSHPATRNWQSSSGCTARAAPPTRSPTTRPTRTDTHEGGRRVTGDGRSDG